MTIRSKWYYSESPLTEMTESPVTQQSESEIICKVLYKRFSRRGRLNILASGHLWLQTIKS